MMPDNIERAAGVMHDRWLMWAEEGVVAGPRDFCRQLARDLADAGLIPEGDSSQVTEWAVRYDDGEIDSFGSDHDPADWGPPRRMAWAQAKDLPKGGPDEAESGYVEAVVYSTVTTHRGPWKIDQEGGE
jgi:hypothetical protein